MKLSQIPYKRITLEEITEKMNSLTAEFDKAANAAEQLEIYKKFDEYSSDISTTFSLLNIRYTLNTADEFYSKEKDYLNEISPYVQQLVQQFNDRLLASKHRAELEKLLPSLIFTKLEYAKKCFDDTIVGELQTESKLETKYSQLTACAQIDFDGQKLTFSQLGKYKQSPDREIRRAAYNAQGAWLEGENGAEVDRIFDEMVKTRTAIAKKLGFKNYHEMSIYRMGRVGYGIDDIRTFREQVRTELVPVIAELKERQAKELGIDKVTLIDDPVIFRRGNPTPVGTPEEIFESGKKMYHEMSPDTGKFIDFMLEHELFDVLSRPGKANGGYCTNLPKYKMPFIFANFNGTSGDVDVLTHEAGHAFAAYKAFDLPWEDIQTPGMETAEIHSMSMEFFAEKWMNLFFGDRADDYRYMHLSSSLSFIPYGTIVDYFQEIVYTNPDMTPAERTETFRKLTEEFCPNLLADGISGYEKGKRWQFQLHIFEYPFYYIDYCLAQTMSLEFYVMMNKDYKAAWETYMKLVSYAGTLPFPELVEKCGMKSPLKYGTLKEVALELKKILTK